jgi:hypothetical protein
MTDDVRDSGWPAIPFDEWQETCATLHLWTQVIGKIRLATTPWMNHSWHVVLYPTARGLTTSSMPHGSGAFQIDFDFLAHELHMAVSGGSSHRLGLRSGSVAGFHREVMEALGGLGVDVTIDRLPNEIPDAIPFHEDEAERPYDPEAAHRFWRALLSSARVMERFRTGYLGKVSPVHFFWGSFDLAVTRFSGREAPLHPGGIPNLPDSVVREAYSHEVSSAGFWPGNGGLGYPAYYSYAWPAPDGFATAVAGPTAASYDENLGEFLLPYDAVRAAPEPEEALLEFLESTYAAAADAGAWDRNALECPRGRPGVARPLAR